MRWKKFTDQELAIIAAALRSIGTVCGSSMCGEISNEQGARKMRANRAEELFKAGQKIIAGESK